MTISNEHIAPRTVHSKPCVPERRGACERFIRTVEQRFGNEAGALDEPPSLDELNGYFEAWLEEHYHQVARMRTKGGNTP